MAKAYATEMAVGVTSKAIQIHGAMGLPDEYPVERYFRDARTMTIPDGTTQIQKLVVGPEPIGIRAFVEVDENALQPLNRPWPSLVREERRYGEGSSGHERWGRFLCYRRSA